MNRWIPLFAILMLNCQGSPPDVRNARWGMSPEQVKETETETAALVKDEGSQLVYKNMMAGTGGVEVRYRFHGDALDRVNIWFMPDTDSLHVDMLRILTEKYGTPIEVDDKEVRDGVLVLNRKWATHRTNITFQAYTPRGIIDIWYSHAPQTLEESKDLF